MSITDILNKIDQFAEEGQDGSAEHAMDRLRQIRDVIKDVRAQAETTEQERDSLRMERDGLEQVRLRDNAFLLARAEKAEQERDEARALKVPPTTDELLQASMAAAVARTEREAVVALLALVNDAVGVAFKDEGLVYLQITEEDAKAIRTLIERSEGKAPKALKASGGDTRDLRGGDLP